MFYDLIGIVIKMYENKRGSVKIFNQTLYKNEQKLWKHWSIEHKNQFASKLESISYVDNFRYENQYMIKAENIYFNQI